MLESDHFALPDGTLSRQAQSLLVGEPPMDNSPILYPVLPCQSTWPPVLACEALRVRSRRRAYPDQASRRPRDFPLCHPMQWEKRKLDTQYHLGTRLSEARDMRFITPG